MNKKIILLTFLAGFVLFTTSCQKDYETPITSVGLLAGQWYVYSADLDLTWTLYTSNDMQDKPGNLIITDGLDPSKHGNLWDFTVTVPCDANALNFGNASEVTNQWYYIQKKDPVIVPYDIQIILKNGKVEPNAVLLPSGTMADKITFTIAFGDDSPAFTEYTMVGYRISGFTEDNGFIYNP